MRLSLPLRALLVLGALLLLFGAPATARAADDDCTATSSRVLSFRAFATTTGCPPTASLVATPTMVPVGTPVTLDASGSKAVAPAKIVAYEWNLDTDPEAEETTTTPTLSHVFGRAKHTVGVKVFDDQEPPKTSSATVDIVVASVPTVSLATSDAAPDSGEAVTLTATASDPDGETLTYHWQLEAGGPWLEGESTRTVSWPTPGERAPRVRVTDEEEVAVEDDVAVDVQNVAPRAQLTGPTVIATNVDATFSAVGSTDDGGIVKYLWDLDGDEVFERETAGPTATRRYSGSTSFTVRVRAVDSEGLHDEQTLDVQVTDGPSARLVAIGSPASFGDTVTFDASASADPDGGPLTYAWDLDGDGAYEDGGPVVTGSWTTPVERTVRVRVTDDEGASAIGHAALVVRNLLPGLTALTPSTLTPAVGETLTLTADGVADADGTVTELRWDTDGDTLPDRTTPGTERSLSVSYAKAGTVRPRVTAVDDDGGMTTRQATVDVAAPAPTPTPTPDPDPDPTPGPGAGTGGGTGTGPVTASRVTGTGPVTPRPVTGTGVVTPLSAPRAADGWAVGASGLSGAAVQKLKTVRRSGVTITCHGPVGTRCKVWLELTAKEARRLKLGRKLMRAGSATGVVGANGRVSVRIKLTSKVAKRLKSARKAALTARAELRDGAGKTVRPTRAVLIR